MITTSGAEHTVIIVGFITAGLQLVAVALFIWAICEARKTTKASKDIADPIFLDTD